MARANIIFLITLNETCRLGMAILLILICVFTGGARAGAPDQQKGIWQSQGYGYIADFSARHTDIYDVTAISCVRNDVISHNLGRLRQQWASQFVFSDQQMQLRMPFEPHIYNFDRLAALPDICQRAPQDGIFYNFDVLAAYFERHYAFFDSYEVDWPKRVTQYRAKLDEAMTDEQLFAVFEELLAPLRDGHVSLSAEIGGQEYNFEGFPGHVLNKLMADAKQSGDNTEAVLEKFLTQYWLENIAQNLLAEKGVMTGDDYIQYGMIDNIGYFALWAMGGYAGRGELHEKADLATLRRTMDDALSLFAESDAQAIIVDLSVNFGGYDFIGREIASRFAGQKYFAYDKRAGDAANSDTTRIFTTPHHGTRFEKPVFVVTTSQSVSAAEIATLALRALPNVTHVGKPTSGAFSDTLTKTLPNGWRLTLSNEIYKDFNEVIWEGKGITPDVEMEIFSGENPALSHPKAIKKLIKLINTGTFPSR